MLHTWDVYYENADTDEEKRLIGVVEALYMGEALKKASEWFEIPSHDLVVKRQEERKEQC